MFPIQSSSVRLPPLNGADEQERAIVSTLLYYDLFASPLRADELVRFVHRDHAVLSLTQRDIAPASDWWSSSDGYWFLRGRERLAAGSQAPTEAGSTYERLALRDRSLDMLRARPLGLGAGAFVVGLAMDFPDADPVEPVHNVVLLAASELGWLAGLLWLIAGAAIVFEIRRARGTNAVVLSAIVIGLIVTGLGDHYLWSLAPGRTLAWLFLGAWASGMQKNESESPATN